MHKNNIKEGLMALDVSPKTILRLLRGDDIRVVEGQIPKDAEFVSCHYDFEKRSFFLVIRHESFDIVPNGTHIPRITDSLIFEVIKKEQPCPKPE